MDKSKWEYKLIKECGTVLGGTTPSTTNPDFWNGQLPWISPAELNGNRYIYDSVKKVTDLGVKAKSLKLLPINSIVLSSRAPIGKVAINKVPLYFNQGFKNIICGPKINSEFLYWWLWGKNDFLNSLGTGATFKEISKKVVENITIPVPPLSEQQEIVDYLDNAFAKIDALKKYAEQQLSDAKALFSTALEEAMTPIEGWEEKTLGDVFRIGTGSTPSRKEPSYFIGTNPWVKTTEVHNCEIWNTEESISDRAIAETNCKLYPEETVLLAMYGQGKTRGQVALLKIKAATNQACAAIQPTNKIRPHFLFYFLLSRYEYVRNLGNGCNQKNLNLEIVKSIPISFPSLPEQQAIVTHLDDLSSKVNQLQENLKKITAECDALKQALLREIFEQ